MCLILAGCQVHKPIEGLCYTDKRGTYLCEETERSLEIERELELRASGKAGTIERGRFNKIPFAVG